jgi:hypothetical protein
MGEFYFKDNAVKDILLKVGIPKVDKQFGTGVIFS